MCCCEWGAATSPPPRARAQLAVAMSAHARRIARALRSLKHTLHSLTTHTSKPSPDAGLLASGAVIFGVQRLVPSYDDSWYKAIKKPEWTPPKWVFPAVWIPLKAMQTYALWLVMKQAPDNKALALPLSLFGAHLALGNIWNGARAPLAA
jgi:hypothetical protein